MLRFFIFYPLVLILLNYFGYPFFWSVFVGFALSGTIALILAGQVLNAIIFFALWSIALSIYEDGRQNDVRFKFWLACLSLFLPIIGIPLYLLLRKKLSGKFGETIKSQESTIQFIIKQK